MENFSITKFLTGGGMLAWWKSWGYGLRLGVSLFIIGLLVVGSLKIWRWIFPETPSNINKPKITVQKDGTLNYTVVQQAESKSPLIRFIPYVDVNGGYGDRKGLERGEQWQAVAGVRLEFDGIIDTLFRRRK